MNIGHTLPNGNGMNKLVKRVLDFFIFVNHFSNLEGISSLNGGISNFLFQQQMKSFKQNSNSTLPTIRNSNFLCTFLTNGD